jgi:hypothetical protein
VTYNLNLTEDCILFIINLKRPSREADHLPPSSAKVKNVWGYTSTPQYVFMAWCLIKQELRLYGVFLC